jgi:hypothetical protein
MFFFLTHISNSDGRLFAPPAVEPDRQHDQYQSREKIICERKNHRNTFAGMAFSRPDNRVNYFKKTMHALRLHAEKPGNVDVTRFLFQTSDYRTRLRPPVKQALTGIKAYRATRLFLHGEACKL